MLKIFTIIILFSIVLTAQNNNQKPCSSPKASEFDFWVGEWTAEWTTQDGKKAYGSNSITKMWDGCVVEENFNGSPGMPFVGKSFSVYNPVTDKWYQTWIDDQGGYIPLSGEFKDGKMILTTERTEKNGKKVLMRMVYYNISEKSFDWNWERSDDIGDTWEPKWIIHYRKK